jgi:Domain of unknown function (DUF4124)
VKGLRAALLCALALGPLGAAHAQQLFKCVSATGKTGYQEDPCPTPAKEPPGKAPGNASPMKAGWDEHEVDAMADGCATPILADAHRFFDAESKFYPEAQIVPPVGRFCTCVARRAASSMTYAEYSKNPGRSRDRITGEALKGGPCKPDGLYAEVLRKTGKMR